MGDVSDRETFEGETCIAGSVEAAVYREPYKALCCESSCEAATAHEAPVDVACVSLLPSPLFCVCVLAFRGWSCVIICTLTLAGSLECVLCYSDLRAS